MLPSKGYCLNGGVNFSHSLFTLLYCSRSFTARSPEVIICIMKKALAWLDSYPKVSSHFDKVLGAGHESIDEMLEANGGLIKIKSVFPMTVAEGMFALLESRKDSEWNSTEASQDYSQNNISHMFYSIREGLDAVYRALALLRPGELHSFSAAKYQTSHHIAPHDDRAYTDVKMDNGSIVKCSRDIAIIFYLTRDWKKEYGGLLIDLEGGKTYVPEFNSAVIFRVPRFHEVTPVKTHRPRYSIFGWWLVPGKKYELNLTPTVKQDEEVPAAAGRRIKRKAPPLVHYSVFGHSNDHRLWKLRKNREASHMH